MPKPMIRIHDIETDEVIDRQMTDAEFEAYKLDQAAIAKDEADKVAKLAAREALLERLGMTEDEAKLLLG